MLQSSGKLIETPCCSRWDGSAVIGSLRPPPQGSSKKGTWARAERHVAGPGQCSPGPWRLAPVEEQAVMFVPPCHPSHPTPRSSSGSAEAVGSNAASAPGTPVPPMCPQHGRRLVGRHPFGMLQQCPNSAAARAESGRARPWPAAAVSGASPASQHELAVTPLALGPEACRRDAVAEATTPGARAPAGSPRPSSCPPHGAGPPPSARNSAKKSVYAGIVGSASGGQRTRSSEARVSRRRSRRSPSRAGRSPAASPASDGRCRGSARGAGRCLRGEGSRRQAGIGRRARGSGPRRSRRS